MGVIYSPISGDLFYTSKGLESFKYNVLRFLCKLCNANAFALVSEYGVNNLSSGEFWSTDMILLFERGVNKTH